MNYQAILFDMDGVIIDTHDSVTAFWHTIAAEWNMTLTQADFEQHIYGCPAEHTFNVLFPQIIGPSKAAIFERMQEYELNLSYIAVPGVKTLLQALKQHGILTALVTSGDRWKVQAVSDQLGLEGLFTAYVTINDVSRGKPHPDAYLLGAKRLDQPPQHCLVFEDAVSGVTAAVVAGATCIGVQSSPRLAAALRRAGACHIISDFRAVSLLAPTNPIDLRYLQLDSGPTFALNAGL
ncbi:MAG: HAD family phosphatase [Anaerolineae bacterium]